MLDEKKKLLIYILFYLIANNACAFSNVMDIESLSSSNGVLPRNLHRHILGVIKGENDTLLVNTWEEDKAFSCCVRVIKCDLRGQILNASKFVIQKGLFMRSTNDPCMPVIWIKSLGYTGATELWVAKYDGHTLKAKLLLSQRREEKLQMKKCWLIDVAGRKKLFVQKYDSKIILIKGELYSLPIYWLFCYSLEDDTLKLDGKALIGEGKTESYEVTIECGVVDDSVVIWVCDQIGKSRKSILRVAQWRNDGKLEWNECYQGGYVSTLLALDPLHGSAVAIFEKKGNQPSCSTIICQLPENLPRHKNLGYGFGGKHQLLSVPKTKNEISWLLLNYEAWNMRIFALDNELTKVAEFNKSYTNGPDVHLVCGRDQSYYVVASMEDHIKIEKLEQLTEVKSLVKDKNEKEGKFSEESVLDAYKAHIEFYGQNLVNATNSQLAKDIKEGDEESSIVSYYRLLSRDKKKAEHCLAQRISNIVKEGVGKEHWITNMQLEFYGRPAIKPLLEIARSGTLEEREIAVEVLYLVPEKTVVKELIKLLGRKEVRKDTNTFMMICDLAINDGKTEAVDFLIKAATGGYLAEGRTEDERVEREMLRSESRRKLIEITSKYEDTPEEWSEQKWKSWWDKNRGSMKLDHEIHPELVRARERFGSLHALFEKIAKKLEEENNR
jgi:hypothetical protein